MEHEIERDAIYNLCTWNGFQGIEEPERIWTVEESRPSRQEHCQNEPESPPPPPKCAGNLTRLPVIQTPIERPANSSEKNCK